jgi:hypothetical protein
VLHALAPVWGASYRIFHGRSIFGGAAQPGFILVCRKEAMATSTNALVMMVAKRPNQVNWLASEQLERFLLWRLKQLVEDLQIRRGELFLRSARVIFGIAELVPSGVAEHGQKFPACWIVE